MKVKHTHEVHMQRAEGMYLASLGSSLCRAQGVTFGFSIGARPYSQDVDGGDLPRSILQVVKVSPGTTAELNGLKVLCLGTHGLM